MTEITVYADRTTGGRSTAWDATYSTARSKGGTGDVDVGTYTVGQLESSGTFYLYQWFLDFDLSSIPAGATIDSAVFGAYPTDVGTSNAYTMNLRLHPWGPTLSWADDFVAGADVSGDTLLAHLASTGWTAGAYRDWTDDALAANLTPGENNYMYVVSSLFEAGTAPGTGEDERLSADDLTNKPRLVINYSSGHVVSPTDDVTTTGWASTPLWSKVDDDPDSPDATVITATAS